MRNDGTHRGTLPLKNLEKTCKKMGIVESGVTLEMN
jgi:hypothetical protein